MKHWMTTIFLCVSFAVSAHGAEPAVNAVAKEIPAWKKPFQAHKIAESKWTVKPGIESRHRFEYRDDFNFRDATFEDAKINLIRNRVSLDVARRDEGGDLPLFRAFAEGYDAQSFASSSAYKTSAYENNFDLLQLYAEAVFGKARNVELKVGRQELAFGDQRLVGAPQWGNTLRVFDAVKGKWNVNSKFALDVFASRMVRIEKASPDSVPHDNFWGLYGAGKPFGDHQFDTFLFIRNTRDDSLSSGRTGVRGPVKEYTLGNLFKGKKWGWNYATEYALQFGSRSRDSIGAWAFHQDLGYQFDKVWMTPKLYTEYNHASGDRDPTDGKSGTFDQLFPANHNKYGYMDLVGFKNMNQVMVGGSLKPHSKVTLASDFHWFFLDAKEAPWYAANGTVVRTANSLASQQLGEELDLTVNIKPIPELDVLLGYSHFFAGPFVQDTGSNEDANFFYIQTTFKI